ncbi:hypothetical protein KIH32_01390 [Pseudomonas fluorescens]|uniref:hypothetical protein n=1 Tax=Pseudomonas fluorescens TaxID=294 RepID=UPI001BDB28A1|nr:hypothetical protein [Pseudomonas fluorescens]MBT0622542.1 hypothetical protein [Pseudomonas fluorescens]
MDLNITFTCGCGGFVDETIQHEGPDFAAVTDEDSLREYWQTIICTECGKDYDAQIISTISETDVNIPFVIDLFYEAQSYAELAEIAAEIEETHQLDIYRKVSTDVVSLLRHPYPSEVKATLNNMLFAQVVTAVEAYLSSSFISTVINSDILIRRLVETDPELAKRQFSLKEIFTQWEGLKLLVAKYLKDLIFHDIKKIKPMYRSVLEIDFGDVAWLFKAISIRHDCVHRNGFDKDGNQHQIESDAITDLVRQCTHLVAQIEENLTARKNL